MSEYNYTGLTSILSETVISKVTQVEEKTSVKSHEESIKQIIPIDVEKYPINKITVKEYRLYKKG